MEDVMAERRYGVQPAPTETTVRSGDWEFRDLEGDTFTRVLFVDVDLTETVAKGAVFEECAFRGVRFNCSVSTDTAFVNCTFTRCSFFDATFTGCKLTGSMFDGCTFGALKVAGGDWSFTGLPGADLRGAAFSRVRMREVDLTGARLEKAVFRDCDLSASWFHQAELAECDLRGSDLNVLNLDTARFRAALIDSRQAATVAAAFGFTIGEPGGEI
ncbi:pentapeptide repeat-containing protein [Actinomadura fulvescens]|uniref:Pentapeptide repeat-containing protein n=1 Tax=Actinomadura fulvescens TaxID=46160 RepID=A0ABP6C1J7_9ACTN